MTIISQPPSPEPSELATKIANTASLGIGTALRTAISDADAKRRAQLEDMRLDEELRAFFDTNFRDRLGGSVVHEQVKERIGTVKIDYTVARALDLEVVLLQIPGAILADGNQIRQMNLLERLLRGKTVRVLSPDLDGYPAPAFNGLKLQWGDEDEKPERRIKLAFVPMSAVRNLRAGTAELGDVLELRLDATTAERSDGSRSLGARRVRETGTTSFPATVTIFLASSKELQADRDEFDRYFREKNDLLIKQGLYLQIVRWENFLDAMSETRLQDEYNEAVRNCNIFVCLLFTKTGKFTDEEFEVAHHQFQKSGRPFIYTFFKDAPIKTGSIDEDVVTLLEFKKKLKERGHFFTSYDDIEHLKRQFRDQLDKLRDKKKI